MISRDAIIFLWVAPSRCLPYCCPQIPVGFFFYIHSAINHLPCDSLLVNSNDNNNVACSGHLFTSFSWAQTNVTSCLGLVVRARYIHHGTMAADIGLVCLARTHIASGALCLAIISLASRITWQLGSVYVNQAPFSSHPLPFGAFTPLPIIGVSCPAYMQGFKAFVYIAPLCSLVLSSPGLATASYPVPIPPFLGLPPGLTN